ncbi:MAG: hypothetical protein Q8O24_05155 [Gallionellaceae bacterium]|nr:hypothetical protein [Gallionellaceae bacterium]
MIDLHPILSQAFFNFLILGSIAGLIVGALLIFKPHWLHRVGLFTNRWVSTRQLSRSLESTITLDPWIYRNNRLSGAGVLVGALYLLYFFTVSLDKNIAVLGLSQRFHVPISYVSAWFDSWVLIAILGATFALVISLFVLFRPSSLKDFEGKANQWISLRNALKPLEIPRSGVDELAFRYAQQVGVMLIIGSLYTLVLLTIWAK